MNEGLGQKGEELAKEKLVKMGYKILDRNFRCKIGEIDIIAKDKNTLVFVEVRSKSSNEFGVPQETVNIKKQKRIRRVAEFYLIKNKLEDICCRFDIVAIIWQKNKKPKIEVIKDAFS